jgi:hypothetical protein
LRTLPVLWPGDQLQHIRHELRDGRSIGPLHFGNPAILWRGFCAPPNGPGTAGIARGRAWRPTRPRSNVVGDDCKPTRRHS